VYERCRRDKTGCPYCSGLLAHKDNCLAISNPQLASEWHKTLNGKLTPYDVTPNADKSAYFICPKNHVWKAKINNRNNNKSNCPYCSGNKVCIDNCLATINPKLASEWHPTLNGKLTPYDVTANSGQSVWWICYRGHIWISTVANRNHSGNGCPKCNMVELKNGLFFDSLAEAYIYLKLKRKFLKIQQDVEYGLKNFRCDFYLPEINTYIEVTTYHKSMTGSIRSLWNKYYKKIKEKQRFVENILGAKFKFIQYKMNKKQRLVVRQNMK
jgi:hypothetical protein